MICNASLNAGYSWYTLALFYAHRQIHDSPYLSNITITNTQHGVIVECRREKKNFNK